MAAQKGRSILLKIGDGLSGPSFSTVGGIRSKTLTVNNETVDITDSDNAPWRVLMADAGIRSVALSGSGVFKDEDAINSVEDLALSGQVEDFQMVFGNGDIMQGLFQVTSFEYGGEHNGEQTYSIALESAAEIFMTRA